MIMNQIELDSLLTNVEIKLVVPPNNVVQWTKKVTG